MSAQASRTSGPRHTPVGWALAFLLFAAAPTAPARTLAVLEFELVDTTLAADDPLPSEHTRQLAPLLREALAARGIRSMEIDPAAVAAAERGVGYLFDRPELAAALARSGGADTIAVCRHDRPTPLFSYLRVRLVDAAGSRLIGDFVVEIKGQFEVTAPHGAARLADGIAAALENSR